MTRKKRWSLKATAMTVSVVLLGVGTVAAQSTGGPWWVTSGLVFVVDATAPADGRVVIDTDWGFSGSVAKAKANYPDTGEYIGCTVSSIPDDGQFLRCAARNAAGETAYCDSLYEGSALDLRKIGILNAAASINADSFITVRFNISGNGGDCDEVTISNTSADFLVYEGGGTGGVASCNMGNSTNLGAFGSAPVTVPNDACVVVTQFAQPWFSYGPNRTMQLQNAAGSTAYPLGYEYDQSCTGASGSGSFNFEWNDQYLPGLSDECALFIKLDGDGSGDVALKYY